MGVKMSKWIETEKGEFVNAAHIHVIRPEGNKVFAITSTGRFELACYKSNDSAHECAADFIRQLKVSKSITIKAKIEEE